MSAADNPQARNAEVWEALYAAGRNDLRYPSETLVRLAGRHLTGKGRLRVLDFGCGTGANLAHLAHLGHELHGVEVAPAALALAEGRLKAQGVQGALRLVEPGSPLPYADGFFDAVIAWGVICYNDRTGWAATVRELERVTAPGGLVVISTTAPGDLTHQMGEPLGQSMYRSGVPGQEGCVVTIPDRDELPALIPGRMLDIGEFGYELGGTRARQWVVSYRMPA